MRLRGAMAALLAGAALLSGCRKGHPERDAIALDVRAEWVGRTKASLLSTSTLEGVEIAASACVFEGEWSDALPPNFFHHVPFRYDGSLWVSEDQYFWPGSGHNLRFFCYAPYLAASLSGGSRAGAPELQFSVAPDARDQVDLLVADSGTVDGARRLSQPISFSHALCAVRFAIKAGSRSGKLSGLQIGGLYNSASRSLAAGSAWTSFYGDASYTLEGSFPYTCSAEGLDLFDGDQGVFLLLPQTRSTAWIRAQYQLHGQQDVLTVSTGDFSIAWEPGRFYTYTLDIREQVYVTVSVAGLAEVGPDAVFDVGVFPFEPAGPGEGDLTGGNGGYVVTRE